MPGVSEALWDLMLLRELDPAPRGPRNDAFRAWFGRSRVVDDQGAPRSVFHGTTAGAFRAFQPNMRRAEQLGFGIHFAEDRGLAARYAFDRDVARRGKAPHLFEVFLAVERPLLACAIALEGTPEFDLARRLAGRRLFTQKDEGGRAAAWVQAAIDSTSHERAERLIREAGFDGVRYLARLGRRGTGGLAVTFEGATWIAFEPTQVKSVFNSGLWDPRSADLHDPSPDPEPAVADDAPSPA